VNLSSNETHALNKFDIILNIENVVGTNFSDTIIGDSFDNIINPIFGSDYVDCKGGLSDLILYYQETQAIQCFLNATWVYTLGVGFNDTVINCENVNGTNYPDLLMGDNQNNVLFGSLDNDIISGGRGNDTLDGEDGTEDWLQYYDAPGPDGVIINFPS